MASWTSGYVSEVDYTHGYYRELSPQLLKLALLNQRQSHSVGRPLRYLELGYGQGLSLNIHAASCDGEFWGTDFNPTQAANARELAQASGANIKAFDDSFAELAARDDLPEFDVITLHGIWSWITEENRRIIVDIARRKLAAGGIFYVSYNCTPGWSPAMPLRHLMALHVKLASNEAQGISNRIDAAIQFTENLAATDAQYFRTNPAVVARLKGYKGQNKNYLAHEFFNADWHPMPFSDVAGILEAAKLGFAASSNLMSHIEVISLTPAQQKMLAAISHPVLRETVRDYCDNQQFRRDIFVKGPRQLTAARQTQLFNECRFALVTPPDDIPSTLKGPAGEATLHPGIYKPLAAALASNGYSPKSVAELTAHPDLQKISVTQIVQALVILTGLNFVQPAQTGDEIAAAQAKTSRLNAHLLERATSSVDVNYLASPVIGGAVTVGRIQQLFLRALQRGKRSPQEWAVDVWPILESQGQRLIKDGKSLATAVENISELASMAQDFAAKRLPILEALHVVSSPNKGAFGTAPETGPENVRLIA